MPSGRQIRAARGLLGWSAGELGEKVGLSHTTIKNIETGVNKRPLLETMEKIVSIFDAEGIEFIDSNGVRERQQEIVYFKGTEGFEDFLGYAYSYLRTHKGEICFSVRDERFLQRSTDVEFHRAKMKELVSLGVTGRILAVEGDFKKTWAELRKRKASHGLPQSSFCVFGDNLALILFNPLPFIILIKIRAFADMYKEDFNAAWKQAEAI